MKRSEPRWLSRLAIDEAHYRQLREHGGVYGLREEHALDAALARPHQRRHYDPEAGLHELAAAYVYGLARDHPFTDGNKRIALVALVAFLDLNGAELTANDAEAVTAMRAVAAGTMAETELAVWIKRHSNPQSEV